MKNKYEKLNYKEDSLANEIYKFKSYEKPIEKLFMDEIDKYKISADDSINTEQNKSNL